jgi:hypothetical protein
MPTFDDPEFRDIMQRVSEKSQRFADKINAVALECIQEDSSINNSLAIVVALSTVAGMAVASMETSKKIVKTLENVNSSPIKFLEEMVSISIGEARKQITNRKHNKHKQ